MTDITFAIDPQAAHDAWVREHTWHLDLIPAIMDALVEATLPTIPVSRGGSRFDRDQVTGGGYFDATPTTQFDYTEVGGIRYQGAAGDARLLWSDLLEYLTAAIDAVEEPARRAPAVGATPNADPISARSEALLVVGWLIDHGEQIASAATLRREPDELFALIRRLRGVHGIFNSPRRTKPELCAICGEAQVRSVWVSGPNGAGSVEVKRCSTCGDETREEPAPQRHEITEVDGHPIQAVGGVSAADRAAFAAVLVKARADRIEREGS